MCSWCGFTNKEKIIFDELLLMLTMAECHFRIFYAERIKILQNAQQIDQKKRNKIKRMLLQMSTENSIYSYPAIYPEPLNRYTNTKSSCNSNSMWICIVHWRRGQQRFFGVQEHIVQEMCGDDRWNKSVI